ncbi:MAG: hypothetical protein QNK23_00715 [Crocinitomicaceae bacterium]|nr:hypothetical protein [Crocinitomicaceae bacterium]
MKNIIALAVITFLASTTLFGQTYLDSTINSSTKKILLGEKGFSIGSYGEAHYNAPIESGKIRNATADLHRVIVFLGYKFNKKLQFFTEIEFEHVKEVYVEQAYVDYSFNSAINLKAGIILIPMGYVNEFHEPTLFNGVERPSVDKYIIPTTWRELGLGLHGIFKKANLKYQIYAVNGFNGYDGTARLSGSSGIRSARQKGAKAIMRTPAVTGKLTFFGLNGLRLGFSGYYGTSETSLNNNLDVNDADAVATADSTRVGITMASINAQYNLAGFQLMIEGNYTALSNTGEYNEFTGSNIANEIMGFYTELSYRWKMKKEKGYPQLIPFVRYENYDTHMSVGRGMVENDAYNREVLTAGVGFQLTPGTIFKTDYQWIKTVANPQPTGMFNLGFGYWF